MSTSITGILCPRCGRTNPRGYIYCVSCSLRLDKIPLAEAPPPEPPPAAPKAYHLAPRVYDATPPQHIDTSAPSRRYASPVLARVVWGIIAAAVLVVAILSILKTGTGSSSSAGSQSGALQSNTNPPTHTALPVPTGPGIASGGLGLTKEAWERIQGPPYIVNPAFSDVFPFYGADNHYQVQFSDTGYLYDLLADYRREAVPPVGLRRPYYRPNPVPLSVALAESLTVIPKDSVELKHFQQPDASGDPMYVVYDYKSRSLAGVLNSSADFQGTPGALWFGAEPGTFNISFAQYQADGGRVSDYAVASGQRDP